MTETNPRAQIGDNNPPDPIDEALEPYRDVISEAENWLDGEAVENDAQLKATDEILKEIKAAIKAVKEARDEATKPLHTAWKAEVARWKPTQDDLERLATSIVAAQDPFKRKLAEQKEAEKRAAWQAAEQARKEAQKAAEMASASDIEAQRDAAQKAQAAKIAEAEASARQKDKVKGMRTVHRYELEDHRAALHWIAKNDREALTDFIEAYVAKNHKDTEINGVRRWTDKEAF